MTVCARARYQEMEYKQKEVLLNEINDLDPAAVNGVIEIIKVAESIVDDSEIDLGELQSSTMWKVRPACAPALTDCSSLFLSWRNRVTVLLLTQSVLCCAVLCCAVLCCAVLCCGSCDCSWTSSR